MINKRRNDQISHNKERNYEKARVYKGDENSFSLSQEEKPYSKIFRKKNKIHVF